MSHPSMRSVGVYVCTRGHIVSGAGPCQAWIQGVYHREPDRFLGEPEDKFFPRVRTRDAGHACNYTTEPIGDLPPAIEAAWLLGGLQAATLAWEEWKGRKVPQ